MIKQIQIKNVSMIFVDNNMTISELMREFDLLLGCANDE